MDSHHGLTLAILAGALITFVHVAVATEGRLDDPYDDTQPCKWGSAGECGGNKKCPSGSRCKKFSRSAVDGFCCWKKPKIKNQKRSDRKGAKKSAAKLGRQTDSKLTGTNSPAESTKTPGYLNTAGTKSLSSKTSHSYSKISKSKASSADNIQSSYSNKRADNVPSADNRKSSYSNNRGGNIPSVENTQSSYSNNRGGKVQSTNNKQSSYSNNKRGDMQSADNRKSSYSKNRGSKVPSADNKQSSYSNNRGGNMPLTDNRKSGYPSNRGAKMMPADDRKLAYPDNKVTNKPLTDTGRSVDLWSFGRKTPADTGSLLYSNYSRDRIPAPDSRLPAISDYTSGNNPPRDTGRPPYSDNTRAGSYPVDTGSPMYPENNAGNSPPIDMSPYADTGNTKVKNNLQQKTFPHGFCPYGHDGKCGNLFGPICRHGTTCKLMGSFEGAPGLCCIDTPGEERCPSGVLGPTCSKLMDCKPGYTCRFGVCCKDLVCPNNWTEGGVCNMSSEQPKCQEGYQCIGHLCCRVPETFCPSGVIGPVCSKFAPCKPGYTCTFGFCCRDPVCPKDWIEGGSCNLLQGHPKCKEGYECINNFCCRATFCPSGSVGPGCSAQSPCKPGYSCRSNYCCREPVCPKDWTEGGACNLTSGQPKCKEGYQCIDDFCCRVPEIFCPSGVIGPVCSKTAPCKPGYTCRFGFCCRDPVCPKDWIEGGSCNLLQGQPKCKEGYECINNFCCRATFCPSGSIGPVCSEKRPCKPGYSCRSNYCCKEPVCPKDWAEGGGVCNLTPGQPKCKEGYQCVYDFCCRVPELFCPSGVIGPVCSKSAPCKPGYTCRFGFCCRDPVCPKDWIEGGSCNLLQGQPKCKEGYECINNFCCRATFCPSGSVGPVCSAQRPCKPGYSCRSGNCCREPVCPEGWLEGRVCNLTSGQPLCKPGFECNNDFCCKKPDPLCLDGSLGEGYCDLQPGQPRCSAGYNCINGVCCLQTVPQLPVCKQPKRTGPCRAAIPRWFYNSETKACESFIYGGCGGNDNNFERQEDCERRCGVITPPQFPVCKQPKVVGPCFAAIPRWFYNYKTKSCESFTYGGCQGNDNNFERKEDCERRCIQPQLPVCKQPKVVGPCFGAFPRWFFNSKTNTCEEFIYGGCQGNENNFERIEDCRSRCIVNIDPPLPVCKQPKKVGPCEGAFPRWFYNHKTKECEQFIYGGCQGNDNNFERIEDCRFRCIVHIEPNICGKNKTSGGSCGGIVVAPCGPGYTCKYRPGNTLGTCCPDEQTPTLPVCKQPKKVGPCKGAFPRWYYNYKTKECEQFTYGGCQGNENNFERIEDCRFRCIVQTEPNICGKNNTSGGSCGGIVGAPCGQGYTCKYRPGSTLGTCCPDEPKPPLPVCKQPKKVGPCKGAFPRWYYNFKTKECEQFIYGGCHGNENNFERIEDCRFRCIVQAEPPLPVCKQPKKVGPCAGAFPRWFYNYKTKECEQFIYGGCQGNDNNFERIEDCRFRCIVQTEPQLPVCKQPKKVGPCAGAFPRWFYNYRTKECEQFTYGGCQGNDNNFERIEDCRFRCIVHIEPNICGKNNTSGGSCGGIVGAPCEPGYTCTYRPGSTLGTCCPDDQKPPLPVCKQPKKVGPCKGAFPRWYYNYKTKECEQFIYGGCQGNENNFERIEDCRFRCIVQIEPPVCPKDWIEGGSCNLLQGQPKCKEGYECINNFCCRATFCPSGSIGPVCSVKRPCKPGYTCRNNFCCREPVCPKGWLEGGVCNLTPGQPLCKSGFECNNDFCCKRPDSLCPDGTLGEGYCDLQPGQPRCSAGYNCVNGVCCLHTEPQLPVCKQPKKVGPCEAAIPRWYYNYKTKECEQFIYGGCQGNDNNFERIEDCRFRCIVQIEPPVCPKDWIEGGSCNLLQGQPKCKEGYECINNFCCRATFCPSGSIGPVCSVKRPCKPGYSCRNNFCCREPVCPKGWLEGEVCNLTPGQPLCKSGFECNNDFCCKRPDPLCPDGTLGEGYCDLQPGQSRCNAGYNCVNGVCCLETEPQLPVCKQPKKVGPCEAAIPRWYYNYKTKECEQFIYGGCQGNDNNFERIEDCRFRCIVQIEPPVCPKDWIEGGSCNLLQGQPKCKEGYKCINNFCCRATFCPSGSIGPVCSVKRPCKPGYSCRNNFCCREPVCPKGWLEGGVCNLTPGQPLCKSGFECNNDFCCKRPDPLCPDGTLGEGYCDLQPGQPRCSAGYNCVNGVCCLQTEPQLPVCKQPKKVGPCEAAIPRWYYNYKTKECEQFIYGGCQGNDNNFERIEDCRFRCIVQIEPPVCPKDWIEGGSCNLLQGQPKCKEGYECINNFCCRATFCPSGSIGPVCSVKRPCKPGYSCRNNFCCREPVCPKGWLEGGVCNLTPGQPLCKSGFECNNDFCCKRPDPRCPDGTLGEGYCDLQPGQPRCSVGYNCVNGVCCLQTEPQLPVCKQPKKVGPCEAAIPRWYYNYKTKECEQFIYGGCQGNDNNFERIEDCRFRCIVQIEPPVCPKDWIEGGSCNLLQGQLKCKEGYECINNFCCRATFCPSGSIGPVCSVKRPCKPGYSCRNNFCCREPVCPKGWLEGGVCNLTPGQPLCKSGFECNNDFCCKRPDPLCPDGTLGEGYCDLQPGQPRCSAGYNCVNGVCCLQTEPQLPVCKQPKKVGPCEAAIPRWYYNYKTKECEQFVYGGCQGNDNNFERIEDCRFRCIVHIDPSLPVCKQPKKVGPCKGAFPRWFYNYKTKACEQFTYGGCQGNDNNFERIEDCRFRCIVHADPPLPVCKQPKKVGPCSGAFPRWFYNYKTKACEQFTYGGCQGNENNFERIEDCRFRCIVSIEPQLPVCKQPKVVGPCLGSFRRWFFNFKTLACEEFIYGGCQGNENNFERVEDCRSRCGVEIEPPVCPIDWIEGGSCNHLQGQPKCKEGYECINKFCCRATFCPSGSIGPVCSAQKPCKPGYSCRSNYCCREPVCPKNWTERGICDLTPGQPLCKPGFKCNNDFCCKSPNPVCPDGSVGEGFCDLQPGQPRCSAGYSCINGVCCQQTDPSLPVCKQPKKVGPCKGAFPRWFYNYKTKACEQFIYGGCQGNDNNFERIEDCRFRCIVHTEPQLPVCKQPKVVGPCSGSFRRWFFNFKTLACEEFIYGGCQGNENNFERVEDCRSRCGVEIEPPVCPIDWIEGGSCNHLQGQPKCKEGYECINKFCCRATFCPSGSIGPVCSAQKPCKPGYSCRSNYCCREPVCPKNWTEGGICDLTPGQPLCKPGFKCNNDFCCKSPNPVCPDGSVGEGLCDLQPGQPRCSAGYNCINGVCCQQTDPSLPVCKQPKKVGPCKGAFPRWFYNYKTKACEQFIYGGCQGNDNNFERIEDCRFRCIVHTDPQLPVCKQPKKEGPCKGAFARWFYNYKTKACEQFTYGGCQGNENNFERIEDCRSRCIVNIEPQLPVCKQPKVVGPCFGSFRRWFFNFKTLACEEFIYGGCQGNENNFERVEDCRSRCGVEIEPPVCPINWIEGGSCKHLRGQPKCKEGYECINNFCCRATFCPSGSVGPVCSAQRPCKPGYSCRSNYCCREPVCPKNWTEGGICDLTPGQPLCKPGFECNNDFCCKSPNPVCPDGSVGKGFCDLQPGQPRCSAGYNCINGVCCRHTEPQLPVCKQPKKIGPCDGHFPRWYFNSKTDVCEKFIFGGCEANDNNFERKEDCERRCEVCPFGQEGLCGTIVGLACRPGTSCRFMGNFPDAAGKCCTDTPPVEPQLPVCKQPKKIGPCDGHFPRWFFNSKTDVCEEFIFGGCEANDNNFERKEDCERSCEVCRYGQIGLCGTIAGLACRPGTSCRFKGNFPDASGKCCVDTPSVECQFGSSGPCLLSFPALGVPCQPGYTCKVPHGGKVGQCCKNDAHECPNGQDGVCGIVGDVGVDCKPGTTCIKSKCCINNSTIGPQLPVCKQPKVVGPCRLAIPRWFFNYKTKSCEYFIYGGCQGNDNNFENKQDCERRCAVLTPPPLPVCKQPKVVGPCLASIPRWFYNYKTKTCEQFIYGGCQGNDNNFERKKDCERRCGVVPEPQLPVCKQPKKIGPCDGHFPRWFFNSKTDVCEQFIFGGCEANDNNFERKEDCERSCEVCPFGQEGLCGTIAGLACRPGTSCRFMGNFPDAAGKCCRDTPPPIDKCPNGQDGVCGIFGNVAIDCKLGTTCIKSKCCINNSTTVPSVPVCKQPKVVGPCRASISRWFYNYKTKACEQFIYGGCQGNDNNFERKKDCERRCGVVPEPQLPVCKQPKKIGPCDGHFPRWFFNSKTDVCEEFIFGGCEANDNNFERKEDCERSCEVCRFGQKGLCGTIAGRACIPGTSCRFKGNFPDAAGKCCIDTPSVDECPLGQDGVCGIAGDVGVTCKPGTICINKKCCIIRAATGRCPPPKGYKRCPSIPSPSCTEAECAKQGLVCCQEKCGSVCKKPVY